MKWIWYYAVRAYVNLGLRIFYRKIIVHGVDNIPQNTAVIFAANHQNAFLDALLIACTNKRQSHFLVRGDVFKKRFLGWLLSTLNMMPVYRIRDGWQSLGKNQKTFDRCDKVLSNSGAVVIFPEGNHGAQRRIRTLSKGFTRVAFESLKKNIQQKIYVVPVGLNYSDAQGFRERVSIYYGKPISANSFYVAEDPASATRLKDELAKQMKLLTTHIENPDEYDELISKLNESSPDYIDPYEANRRIAQLKKGEALLPQEPGTKKNSRISVGLYFISTISNYFPMHIWTTARRKIKDPVFIGSLKFVHGIFLFPLFYLAVTLIVYFTTDILAATATLMTLVILSPAMLGHLTTRN
jgi:1-acyl-sn-glycerol-3-phosphate acyltransferase